MPNKMLIDASHPEETRVVVTRGNRIEEFDFESQDKKQLKGNIYLARVTRVEPSLQAAFVEYGGNRHGFLAFSEIHPDYYQIPVADRQALLRAEAEAAEEEDEEDEEERGKGKRRRRGGKNRGRRDGEHSASDAGSTENGASQAGSEESDAEERDGGSAPDDADGFPAVEAASGPDTDHHPRESSSEAADAASSEDENRNGGGSGPAMAAAIDADVISEERSRGDGDDNGGGGEVEEVGHAGGDDQDGEIESVGAEDALEELPSRRKVFRKQYKIQEVIKRRQILLVQVVKEERGNKGAALTTYLSLAGRYSVLMPNTARGGGISRKITSAPDRKRLKDVVKDLDVPQGMGVILRTAGANRTKPEIKRDYEYLMRLWENVRTLTLQSTAPALVYEEGSLIKRSVRDLYNKDIDEILVAGEDGYREAKDFMRMLMPSHAKVVQPYRDIVPIFARNGIEAQLDRMLQPQVTLKSGGYIIINQTEALVSIDVNSGRSTKEHSIEDTALQTNLEAAEEVARQLRLRDLAGLIVIDFIDMEENRNNRSVEKRLKDHLKNDRARIQVGRISHFGLLEMSRQRIRASVLDSTMKPCPHCGGTGHVRSDSSVALHVVRAIEEFLLKDARSHITVRTPVATALYVLNHKRSNIVDLEARFGLTITIEADESVGVQHYAIVRGAAVERPVTLPLPAPEVAGDVDAEDDAAFEAEIEADAEAEDLVEQQPRGEREERQPRPQQAAGEGSEEGRRKRRRRRKRRGGRDRDAQAPVDGETASAAVHEDDDGDQDDGEEAVAGAAETADDAGPDALEPAHEADAVDGEPRKRRRGKRGGRKNRREDGEEAESPSEDALAGEADDAAIEVVADATPVVVVESEPVAAEPVEEAPAKPKRAPRRSAKTIAAEAARAAEVAAETEAGEALVAQTPPEASASPEPSESIVVEAKTITVDAAEIEEPASARPSRRRPAAPIASEPVITSTAPAAAESDEAKPRKAGWWQRKSFF